MGETVRLSCFRRRGCIDLTVRSCFVHWSVYCHLQTSLLDGILRSAASFCGWVHGRKCTDHAKYWSPACYAAILNAKIAPSAALVKDPVCTYATPGYDAISGYPETVHGQNMYGPSNLCTPLGGCDIFLEILPGCLVTLQSSRGRVVFWWS